MNGWYLLVAAGMLVAAGAVLGVRSLRPVTPSLHGSLAQLRAAPPARPAIGVPVVAARRWWLPASVAQRVDRHLGVSDADLAVIGWSREQLAARKVLTAGMLLVSPLLVSLMLIMVGLSAVAAVPAFIGLGLAVVGWMLPSQSVREQATAARARFRSSLEFYLTLVAGERRARGSVEQALSEAAAVSDSREFVQMRRVIRRATLAGRKPWADLRQMGVELDIAELRSLADIAEVASDGASVYQTLLASAASLRGAALNDARAAANEMSERMSRPLAMLVLGMTLLVLFPVLLRMVEVA